MLAAKGSVAFGHVDLLTVLTHKVGHVLGLPDIPTMVMAHNIMTETIGLGTRRTVTPVEQTDSGLIAATTNAQTAQDWFFADLAGALRKYEDAHGVRPSWVGWRSRRERRRANSRTSWTRCWPS